MSNTSSVLRLALLLPLLLAALGPALAQQASHDAAALAGVIARLERRVASLEADAKAAREEARRLRSERAALQGRPPRSAAAEPARLLPVADAPEPAYALPPPRPSWTGLYVGASAGGVRNRLNYRQSSSALAVSNSTFSFSRTDEISTNSSLFIGSPRNKWGALSGLHGGYNFEFGPGFVIGVQGDAAVLNLGDEFRLRGGNSFDRIATTTIGATRTTRTESFQSFGSVIDTKVAQPRMVGSLALRAGAAIANDVFLYGLGGWSQVGLDKFDAPAPNFFFISTTNNTRTNRDSRSSIGGPMVGLGAEMRLDRNWSVFSEYRYVRMLPVHADSSQAGTGSSLSSTTASAASVSSARLAGDLHFLRFGFSRYFH